MILSKLTNDMNRSDSPEISLSTDEFCELYNDIPKVLIAYAKMVNLSAETYRQTYAQVIFEEENNSNYWIISFNNTANDAWLVPNPLRKVNYAALKSLPFAFESNNKEFLKQLSFFTLSEPAQVIALPTEPTTWKLIKRGVIVFGDVGRQNKELQDIINSVEIEEMVKGIVSNQLIKLEKSLSILHREVENQHVNITAILNQQKDKKIEIDGQSNSIERFPKDYGRQIQYLVEEQQRQAKEVDVLSSALASVIPLISKASDKMTTNNVPIAAKNIPELSFAKKELDFLKEYNSNLQEVPSSLRDGSKNVSITDDAVARIRDGNESNITFKLNRIGNFLIVSRGGYCYLVPNTQRRIVSLVFIVAQAIYKCDGYSENYQNFRLIKPALVLEESNDCWKLSQKGILEFLPVVEAKVPVARSPYLSLDIYRKDIDIFKKKYDPKTVAENINSFQKRWSGNHQEIILGENSYGNYWLFNEGSEVYLIPIPKLKFNDTNMRNVENFFECINYTLKPTFRSLLWSLEN